MTDQITNPDVVKSIYDLEGDYVEFVEKCAKGGIKLDLSKLLPQFECVTPLYPGELMVIEARTGHGKSALAQAIAKMCRPMHVLYMSLELPGTLMFKRFAAMNNNNTQREVEQAYERKGVQQLSQMDHIWTCDYSRLTPEQVKDVLHLAQDKADGKIGLLIVDYMGLLSSEVNKSRYERTTDGIQDLKRMAKDENIITAACCQVTETGKDEDEELFLGCTRDSRDIENSAGLVIGAWRTDANTLWTKVLKQTQGPSGSKYKWPNNFDGAKMQITPRMQTKPAPDYDIGD